MLLVLAPDADVPPLPGDLEASALRIVRDPELHAGPLVGLTAALEATTAPAALLVGGDMPDLEADVLRAMLAVLEEHPADVVLLEGPGPVQSMPAAIRTAPARLRAREITGAKGRALRALYDRLRVVTLAGDRWTRLDPGRGSLRDVDTPATVETVWRSLVDEMPVLREYERTMSVAVNADYAKMSAQVADGDEVAFLPPVSGG